MVMTRKKLVETMKFHVSITQPDIDNGECRLAHRCMHKVGIARTLNTLLKGEVHHVRVDAGTIRFNHGGYRWEGKTPKIAKANLIKFDNKKTTHLVKPHEYDVEAVRKSRIRKIPSERQEQINQARRERIKSGLPDKAPNRLTLHQRIVGFA